MSEYKIVWDEDEYVIKDSAGEIAKRGFRYARYAIEFLRGNGLISHEEYENFLKEFGYAD